MFKVHRKKNDPPPSKPKSFLTNGPQTISVNDNDQISKRYINPLPKVSAYFRRKSESYLNRRAAATTTTPVTHPTVHHEQIQEVVHENPTRSDSFKSNAELF